MCKSNNNVQKHPPQPQQRWHWNMWRRSSILRSLYISHCSVRYLQSINHPRSGVDENEPVSGSGLFTMSYSVRRPVGQNGRRLAIFVEAAAPSRQSLDYVEFRSSFLIPDSAFKCMRAYCLGYAASLLVPVWPTPLHVRGTVIDYFPRTDCVGRPSARFACRTPRLSILRKPATAAAATRLRDDRPRNAAMASRSGCLIGWTSDGVPDIEGGRFNSMWVFVPLKIANNTLTLT